MTAIQVHSSPTPGYEVVGRCADGETAPLDPVSTEFVVETVETTLCRQGYRPPAGYRIEVDGDPQTGDPTGFPGLGDLVSAAVDHFGRPEPS